MGPFYCVEFGQNQEVMRTKYLYVLILSVPFAESIRAYTHARSDTHARAHTPIHTDTHIIHKHVHTYKYTHAHK